MQKWEKMLWRRVSGVMALGDGAEVVEGLADVLGDEVGGDAVLDGVDGAAEGVGAVGEGFVVAAVGHD